MAIKVSSKPVTHREENKIGILQSTSYTIGAVIGSGIFLTPTSILRNTGSIGLSLVIWVVGAILSLIGAFCYIELGTSIRESGGDYAYVSYVGWKPFAFAIIWVGQLFGGPCVTAIFMETFAEYIVKAIPMTICFDEIYLQILKKLAGYLILWLLLYANFHSLRRFAGVIQVVVTSAKIFAMLLISVTGFYFIIFRGYTHNFKNIWQGTEWDAGNIVVALYSGLFSYGGYATINSGIEEIKNPKRTLPLAILGGTVVVTILYLAVNVSYFAILGREGVMSSIAVAETFSQEVLGWFSYVVPIVIGIVLCGSLNSDMFGSSRVTFAAARRGQLPAFLAVINPESDSPRAAVFLYGALGIGASFVGDPGKLIAYVSFAGRLAGLMVSCALLWIRFRKIIVHPDAVRAPLILIILNTSISFVLVVIPLVQKPEISLISCGLFLMGLAIYFIIVRPINLPRFLTWTNQKLASASQKFFVAIPDEKVPAEIEARQLSLMRKAQATTDPARF